jgi:hypothetical protein
MHSAVTPKLYDSEQQLTPAAQLNGPTQYTNISADCVSVLRVTKLCSMYSSSSCVQHFDFGVIIL